MFPSQLSILGASTVCSSQAGCSHCLRQIPVTGKPYVRMRNGCRTGRHHICNTSLCQLFSKRCRTHRSNPLTSAKPCRCPRCRNGSRPCQKAYTAIWAWARLRIGVCLSGYGELSVLRHGLGKRRRDRKTMYTQLLKRTQSEANESASAHIACWPN